MKPMCLMVYRMLTSWLPESRGFGFKCLLLRWAGAKIGQNVRIYTSVRFLGTGMLEIGDDVHLGPSVFISTVAPYAVKIGSHVDVGPQVAIMTGSHRVNPSDAPEDSSEYLCRHMAGEGTGASVTIGDGCWLGARSTVLPGVTLPRKTLVAAGSVVTKSPGAVEKCLVAGSPAVVKKMYCA